MQPDPSQPWYHGSPTQLTTLRQGSTITQNRDLARIFSHKPPVVSIADDGTIRHNGTLPGYLYLIAESVSASDVIPHPRTTMHPGDEWLTTRDLRLQLLCPTEPDPQGHLSDQDIARLRMAQRTSE